MMDRLTTDLNMEEIRRLLVGKQVDAHKRRLDAYQRTGKVGNHMEGQGVSYSEQGELGQEKASRRSWLDHMMSAVEALSVLLLVGLLWNGAMVLRRMNLEMAASFRQPAELEPTPMISAIVLPEGHTPPNGPGGAQPNVAEIPEHLRPLVQSLANIPVPTPGSQQAVRIQIPAIGVDAPIVQGDGWEQLKRGVAQHAGTPDPGENGNIVLSGHNDVYGEVFRYVDQLKPGDVVIVYTFQRQYTYVVTDTQIVEPTQVDVMGPTLSPTLTLISCYPYLVDDHRIEVSAGLQRP